MRPSLLGPRLALPSPSPHARCKRPRSQLRSQCANGATERERERGAKKACAFLDEERDGPCAPQHQAARALENGASISREYARQLRSFRMKLRDLSFTGNLRGGKRRGASGFERASTRGKARIKDSGAILLLLLKPSRASLTDLAPSRARTRALFRPPSRATPADENARSYETQKHLRAARPGGAAGTEAWLEFLFSPLSLSLTSRERESEIIPALDEAFSFFLYSSSKMRENRRES